MSLVTNVYTKMSFTEGSNANLLAKAQNISFPEAVKIMKEKRNDRNFNLYLESLRAPVIRVLTEVTETRKRKKLSNIVIPTKTYTVPEAIELLKNGNPYLRGVQKTKIIQKFGKNTGKVYNPMPSYKTLPTSEFLFDFLQDNYQIYGITFAYFEEIYATCNKYVACGGTQQGQYKRFLEGAEQTKLMPTSKMKNWNQIEMNQLKRLLRWNKLKINATQINSPFEMRHNNAAPKINLKAQAGMPFGPEQDRKSVV